MPCYQSVSCQIIHNSTAGLWENWGKGSDESLCWYSVVYGSEEGKRALIVNTLENNLFTSDYYFEIQAVLSKFTEMSLKNCPRFIIFNRTLNIVW